MIREPLIFELSGSGKRGFLLPKLDVPVKEDILKNIPSREEIEDFPENFTRFLIVSKRKYDFGPPAKTSIVFSIRDIPGALFKSLSVFFLRDINLVKIESRPLRGKPWEYLFYLDFNGAVDEQRCANALRHLEEIADFIKILGSYPSANKNPDD